MISALFKTVVFLWSAFFLGPPLWMMWHNRCLWTDATAARRDLDPDDLASALEKMTDVPEGAESHAYLFLGARETKRSAVADRRRYHGTGAVERAPIRSKPTTDASRAALGSLCL